MRVLPLLVPCVLFLSMAGCLGDDEAPVGAPAQPQVDAGDGSAVPNANMTDDAAPGVPVELPLEYDGATHFAVCAYATVAGNCQFIEQSDTAFREIVEVQGTAQRLVGTITWDPVSPLSQQLTAILFVQSDEGGWTANESTPVNDGPSPLILDWDLSAFGDRPLQLVVMGFQQFGAPEASVGGELKQPFRVDATLHCLLAPQ